MIDALIAAALEHMRRSVGTSAGMHLARVRANFAALKARTASSPFCSGGNVGRTGAQDGGAAP